MGLTFGSVCSGIEAASVGWHPLGWRAAWFAEVDRAASDVLAYRFPDVPNHGDMTKLAEMVRRREIPAPDILVGGTPCQAFSVAGMRRGLDDERGQLTLAYVDLANAIDEIRIADGLDPVIIVWENVPGVLTSKDNAFGCFLAGLAGESDQLRPAGRKWTNAGAVLGPERAIAWRTLDAQWFGLAQRRRRVFVVASAREGFDPAAILLEFDGVRRDSPPSREAGEIVAGTLDARTDGGGFPGTDGACAGHVVPTDGRLRGAAWVNGVCPTLRAGGNATGGDRPPGTDVDTCDSLIVFEPVPPCWDGRDVSQTLDAVLHKGQTMPEKNRFPAVLQPIGYANAGVPPAVCVTGEITHTLKAEGFDASEDGTGRGQPITLAFQERGGRPDGRVLEVNGDLAYALTAPNGGGRAQERNILDGYTMAVRRLMPVECERLQGFPDGWTLVPNAKGKLAADGPRYKQCGNSMATHCMNWIGRRIAASLTMIGHNGGPVFDEFEALLG